MQIFRDPQSLPAGISTVLSVGKFDGVHLGHQRIIGDVTARARMLRASSAVVTFDPHPSVVLPTRTPVQILTPLPLKMRLLERLGLDVVVVLPFTREFATVSPEAFVKEILVDTLHAKEIHEGSDFHFGKSAGADCLQLVEMGKRYGFGVCIHEPVHCGDRSVSSSTIRQLLDSKEFELARLMLARSIRERSSEFRPA